MMPMGDFWGWGMFMMLLMPVLWIGLIAAAVWIALRFTSAQPRSEGSPALRILEERLARGDIDLEEFRARREAITSKS